MSTKMFGFIGCGNMGSALAQAVAKSVGGNEILLSDPDNEKATSLAQLIGANVSNNEEIVKNAKYIFLGVKPQVMAEVLSPLASFLKARGDRFILVTMAAGLKISKYNEILDAKLPTIRIMPNTPVAVNEGMLLYATCPVITNEEIAEFENALKFSGKLDKIPEDLIDAGSVVSGCGPAFVYTFANALAKAGEKVGLSEDKAILYAAQTLKGAAELLLTSGETPEVLRQRVCSPKGSTIEGVEVLINSEFDNIVSDTVAASFKRTKELGK